MLWLTYKRAIIRQLDKNGKLYICYILCSFGIICNKISVCISYNIYIYAHIHVYIRHDELKIILYKINVYNSNQ